MADYTLKCTGEQLDAAVEKANSAFVALDNKLNKDDVYDGLDSEDTSKALSARQGKLLKDWVDNCITYNEDINIGTHSFTMSNVFTVASDSSLYTQITPGSISLQNPIGTLNIGTYSLSVNGTTIYWPTLSADPNGKYFALKSDIPPVDNKLSTTSTNPVENRVITETINEIQTQVNNNEQDIGTITATVVDKKYIDNNFVKNLGAAADYRVYMANPEGTNTFKSASNSAVPDTIPLRNNSGQIALPNQLIEAPGVNQAISKAYGDTKYLKAGTDINLEKNLEVKGTTKLTGGMEPLHTFNIGPYNNQAIILEIYQETTCSGISGFDEIRTVQMFSGLCQYILKGYNLDGSDVIIKRYCVGTYYLDNNKELTGFVANCQGLQNKFSLITYDKNAAPDNVWSINDYLPETEAQRKLWRHSLTLNGNIYWELISARKDTADGPANLAFIADASYGQSFIIDKSTIITYGTDMVWRIGDQEITTVSDNCTPINHNAAAD